MTTSRSRKQSTGIKILPPILIILALVLGGLLIMKSWLAHPPQPEGSFSITENSVLPDFTLTRIDGTSVQFSQIPGKIFLINFWATWCEACVEEMPSIVALRNSYKERGFEVLGVNLDETPEAMVPKAIRQFKIDFPIFKDPEGKVAELFDVRAIPLTVIVNHQRKILFVKDGEQDWNSREIQSRLEKWLSG